MTIKPLLAALCLLGGAERLGAQEEKAQAKPPVPSYRSQAGDMSRYHLYADGGFHADWYVGFNNCWIVRLPPIDVTGYAKAYIGARIGRSKIMSHPMGWDPNPIPGKIYMGVSRVPSFSGDNTFFLAEAEDLPREPLPNDSISGVTSAQWFWASVPMSHISSDGPNYLAVWSNSRYFTSASSAPIIAAALSDASGEESAWLNRSIKGAPPSGENALETPLAGIKPAIAVKLVPPNDYKVLIRGFMAETDPKKISATFSVIGEDVRAAWLELSYDKFEWQRVTRYLFAPPYHITLDRTAMSSDMFYLRAAAVDALENTGYSREILIPALPGGN